MNIFSNKNTFEYNILESVSAENKLSDLSFVELQLQWA